MRDERDAARPEPAVLGRAGDLAAEFGRELAMDARDVDPDLFEDAALHDRHRAAAAARPQPLAPLEPPRHAAGSLVLDRLECRADAVAQRGEPAGRLCLSVVHAKCPVWRRASLKAIAPATATLSDRAPACNGIRSRAAAARCTRSGTPAHWRPRRRVSVAENEKSWRGVSPAVVSSTSRDPGSRSAAKAVHD